MSARSSSRHESVALIVGGDARQGDRKIGNIRVKAIASSKFCGNGAYRAAVAAIRGGSVVLVILLMRWLGHSEEHAIRAVCRSRRVRYVVVQGGMSSAWNVAKKEIWSSK